MNFNDTTISEDIKYIGVNDKDIDLFESQYIVPNGVSYNSYLIKGWIKFAKLVIKKYYF